MPEGTDVPREDGPGDVVPVDAKRNSPWSRALLVVVIAAVVAAVVLTVRVAVGSNGGSGAASPNGSAAARKLPSARFVLMGAGRIAADSGGTQPWFQVRAANKSERTTDSVPPPSPNPGPVTEILAGPDGTFMLTASTVTPCETHFFSFRLTAAGKVSVLTALKDIDVAGLVAGLAISPDKSRIAYALAGCTPVPPNASRDPLAPPVVGAAPG